MGSTGSGSFTDYPGSQGSGEGGESSASDNGYEICGKALGNIKLEEVESCEYYEKNGVLPKDGLIVNLRRQLYGKRLAIVDENDVVIGLLPTKYNYLRGCMEQGYQYKGYVIVSTQQRISKVIIDLAPQANNE